MVQSSTLNLPPKRRKDQPRDGTKFKSIWDEKQLHDGGINTGK